MSEDLKPIFPNDPVPAGSSSALVRFATIGPALQCDIGFENDEKFDPKNLAHLLAWYVQDQCAHLIKPAYELFKERARTVAEAMAADANTGVLVDEGKMQG